VAIVLSPTKLESLLYHICVKYGFCLRLAEYERLCANPPTEVTAFTDAVYRAEGLDPATADPRVYDMVHAAVERTFGGDRPDG